MKEYFYEYFEIFQRNSTPENRKMDSDDEIQNSFKDNELKQENPESEAESEAESANSENIPSTDNLETSTENLPPKAYSKRWTETYVVEVTRLPGRMEDFEIEELLAPFNADASLLFEADEITKFREARLTFESKEKAVKCTAKLHKKKVNSMAKLAKKPDSPGIQIFAKIVNLDLKKEGQDRSEAKKSRIIVRNLRFNISETKLKRAFSDHGTVTDVNIPLNDKGKKLGFAFVQFVSRWEANKAIRYFKVHNKIQGRPVAVDLALPKDQYLAEKSAKGEEADDSGSGSDDDDGEEEVKGEAVESDAEMEDETDEEAMESSDSDDSDGSDDENEDNEKFDDLNAGDSDLEDQDESSPLKKRFKNINFNSRKMNRKVKKSKK